MVYSNAVEFLGAIGRDRLPLFLGYIQLSVKDKMVRMPAIDCQMLQETRTHLV